jgi:hypothetical protein
MSDQAITEAEFKEALPAHIRKNVNPALLQEINSAILDPERLAVYRENVVGLASVMREGRFKIGDYLTAVKYVSHKVLGDTNVQAWAKTFPTRFNDATQRGNTPSEMASIASRYNSSKLVTLLMGQSMMPTHIVNAPVYQKAINHLATLMTSAKSEMVQCTAASKLVEVLRPPEVQKIELDIGVKEDESIRALRETTMKLVGVQEELIRQGSVSVRSIAESKLIGQGDTSDEKVVNV